MHIAIVGPTGCGKTTMINLLMRFYDVDQGDIKLEGTSIYKMDRHVNTFMPQLSGGKITPITLSNTRASYDSWSNIYSAEKEALDLAKKNFGIDSKNYDLNGDTYVDNVTFIFAGDEDQRGNALYAHKTDFGAGYTIDGKDVGCINVLMANTILQEDFYSTGEIAHGH